MRHTIAPSRIALATWSREQRDASRRCNAGDLTPPLRRRELSTIDGFQPERYTFRDLLAGIAAGLVAAMAGAAFAVALSSSIVDRPAVHVFAFDVAGQVFDAGDGDTCAEALRGAVMPAGVASVECR